LKRNGLSGAIIALGCMLVAGVAQAQLSTQPPTTSPAQDDRAFTSPKFALQLSQPESVYAPLMPPRDDEGVNMGGVHFDLTVSYFTDYVYRGIELFEPIGGEDRASLQIAAKLAFDLGKLPHPFIGVFVNYSDSDPISSFQEIRPFFGATWTIRPLILSAGHNTYLYPDRDDFQTSELWGEIEIDDSFFFRTENPIFSPYFYGAYDYDLYNGWYLEAGVKHEFVIEDTGLTLTANAHVAYVRGINFFATSPTQEDINGFQHYQLGLIASYSLNHLLNFPKRYGEWSFEGYVNYTDGLEDDLHSETQLWGGAGIRFSY
jgi:hypothetical protein